MVLAGIQSGEVRPLPVTVFKRNETEEAFRYLAKGEGRRTAPLLSPCVAQAQSLGASDFWQCEGSSELPCPAHATVMHWTAEQRIYKATLVAVVHEI